MPVSLPAPNIGEVTLIGTGGGYGESIVIHAGNNNWLVIDSCINPYTKESLPLEYLKSIGVNIEDDVKLILCSHWHDDHIKGIASLLDACTASKFAFANVTDKKKFLQFVQLDYEKIKFEVSNTSTEQFAKCLEILENRNSQIILAHTDRILQRFVVSESITSEVISLSPSDFTSENFNKEISTLISDYGNFSKKIISKSPNAKSVVVFLKLGYHRALLGADLEVSNDDREGWINILNTCQTIDKKSTLFKISHHGSENGYHSRIFSELLEENPVAKLTPWNRKDKLPTKEMVETLLNHTSKLYITATIDSSKPKERNRKIEKIIKNLNFKIREVKYKRGIIQSRIDISDPNAQWTVELLESAKSLGED